MPDATPHPLHPHPVPLRVLVVDDEPAMADLITRAVRQAHWLPEVAASGADALRSLRAGEFDVVVLDVVLPDMDGIEVCRVWRTRGGRTPILLLTVRDAIHDRVRGLDAGADDYLVKPFAVEELLARLRALARRPLGAASSVLRIADLEVDTAAHAVRRGGTWLRLSAREYALVEFLAHRARRVVTRAQLLEGVWDDNFDPVANVVDALVMRVRRKLDGPGLAPLIHTVRGVGYMLSDRAPGQRG